MRDWSPPLLSEISASLSTEIERNLMAQGEAELAKQVARLKVKSRCRCGDDFCATMHTGLQPRRGDAFGPSHRNVEVDVGEGMVILDVVDESIVTIEVIDRPDIRERLRSFLAE